ncbi:uncharacterized protein LOC126832913 [Adelges cooleyi]|uniref:uncharacterized protein LOC126832913 n=1 Tax=Adelges cooleyi TaxID=133065 RepID=UPI00217FC250|nr:uncharacterized protein LOC126832913 [Adelges cooleyi]
MSGISFNLLQYSLYVLVFFRYSESLHILAVAPYAAKSHWNFMTSVLHALTDEGHSVTVLTPFLNGNYENYTEIDSSGSQEWTQVDMDVTKRVKQFGSIANLATNIKKVNSQYCGEIYSNARLQEIIAAASSSKASNKFDVVFAQNIGSDCFSFVAKILDLPLIYVHSVPALVYEASFVGEEPNPAYVTTVLSPLSTPKTFRERVQNTVIVLQSKFFFWFVEIWAQKFSPKPYDLNESVKPSAMFINSHLVVEPARPNLPNVVSIGGIHLSEPKAIPKDILEFIENSPNGVIYLSFGSTIAMSKLPDHIQKSFTRALGQLPQRILWKFESEMEDKPDNVMTKTWFPQRDILVHPNVVLFIGHGGISGIYEAIDGGVPILGFPMIIDQPRNLANLEAVELAISLDLMSVTETQILKSVNELINNKKYSRNAKTASGLFKDRPISPKRSVVYWTEYVARHKETHYLKSKALDLAWYELLLLDVFFAVSVFMLFVTYSFYMCYTFFYKLSVKYLFGMSGISSNFLRCFVYIAISLRCSQSLRILAVAPIPAKSHWYFMTSVLRSLTDEGHIVTVFTPFLNGNYENYTEIDTAGNREWTQVDMDLAKRVKDFGDIRNLAINAMKFNNHICDELYANNRLKEIIIAASSTDQFDVIMAQILSSNCLSCIARILNLPLINIQATPSFIFESPYVGEEPNPAYVTTVLSPLSTPKSFQERVLNSEIALKTKFYFWFAEAMTKHFYPKPYDFIEPVIPSVIFINSNLVIEPARPNTPNIINIGGIHLSGPKAIPKDILEFIENSPNGVIYISFGSTIAMSKLPDHIQKSFKRALGQLPQRILWKFESEMEDKPDNVMTKTWFPQRDILVHPNVILFIGHGGISGIYEAIDGGVPILGFPMIIDQPKNLANLEAAEMAISLDLMSVTEIQILNSARELINNEIYSHNAKIVSELFKDRVMPPKKSVVYWTEYVVRHNGSPHLKSKAFDLTWYEILLLDVLLACLTILLFVTYLCYKFFTFIYMQTRKYCFYLGYSNV